jgi:hypothetical protein
VISFDSSAEPVIAVDLDMPNMAAQEWVRREHVPLVILECKNGQPVQSVLIHEDSEGSVVLEPFWRIIDPAEAVRTARRLLKQSK